VELRRGINAIVPSATQGAIPWQRGGCHGSLTPVLHRMHAGDRLCAIGSVQPAGPSIGFGGRRDPVSRCDAPDGWA
jgi:hypothetical protein